MTATLVTSSNVADWLDRSEWPAPRPRVATWDPFVDVYGDDAVALCELAGLELDEWQEISLRLWLGVRPDGSERWAHRLCGEIVPRQDGKGAILEARQLAGMFLVSTDLLIIHTAHEFKTATESFLRLAALIEDTPKLNREVETIYTANGKESIVLRETGSRPRKRVKFLARSPKSGRGFTSDLLIYDEAMAGLSPRMVGASGPTQSARPNPQTIYTGTAGDDESEVLAKIRDDGITGTPRLAFVEYAAGDPDDHTGEHVNLDDRDEWFRANPAMHGPNPRMSEEAVETDRSQMDDENFARERLCIWWRGQRASVIDADQWQALIGKSEPGKDVVFALDIPPERDSASIGVASLLPDGRRHVELIEHRPGTGWVVDRLVELDAKWLPGHIAVQPSSPAGSLIEEITTALEKQRVPILPVTGADLAAACGLFVDLIRDQKMIVQKNHTAELAAAADAVRKRELVDGGFVWNRRDTTTNIAPLVALTLAAYAVGKEPKTRRRRRTENPF